MHSEKQIKETLEYIKKNQEFLRYNNDIFDILEGDLLTKLKTELNKQFTGSSASSAALRAAPINILRKIVDKLSRIYHMAPIRTVQDGNTTNQGLVDFYSEKVNDAFQALNENYNSYKAGSIEIFENTDERAIGFRALLAHQFLVYSDNKIDPLKPTHFVKFMGKDENDEKQVYWLYDNYNFTPFTDDGKIYTPDLAETDGENKYGILPFSYVSKSKYLLIPMPDRDIMQMTLLIPVLLSDQNFGSMYLSHPILYGINVNSENLKLSPDHFWSLKSERGAETTPEIGALRAEPDLASMMNSAISQLSMWLESRNIHPGTIGKVSADNFSSGVSKLISEMDTIDDRKLQGEKFNSVETDFWRRLGVIHNYLASGGRIENKVRFVEPEKMVVNVEYQEEKILETRVDKVAILKQEIDAGLTSREKALAELNPRMNSDQIKELMNEMAMEKGVTNNAMLPVTTFQSRGFN